MDLQYFKASEFGPWWPVMDRGLLVGLDRLRAVLGKPVIISPASGSLGRVGKNSESMHYPTPMVRAADVMFPAGPTLREAYDAARSLGMFSGVGAYPDWTPYPGLHLDVRPSRTPADPALWSARRVAGEQKYYGLDRAWA